jgi:hypothetical protein
LEIFLALSKKKIPKKKMKEGWKITMVVTKDMLMKPKRSGRALKLSQRIAYLSEVLYVTGGGTPGARISIVITKSLCFRLHFFSARRPLL